MAKTWLERMADIEGGDNVTVSDGIVEGERIDRMRFNLSGQGECRLILNLWPQSSYEITMAGRKHSVHTNAEGQASVDVPLSEMAIVEAVRH